MFNELKQVKRLVSEMDAYNKRVRPEERINFHPVSFPIKLEKIEILWRQADVKDYEPRAIWLKNQMTILGMSELMAMSDTALVEKLAPTSGGGEHVSMSKRVQQIYSEVNLLPGILRSEKELSEKELEEVERRIKSLFNAITKRLKK